MVFGDYEEVEEVLLQQCVDFHNGDCLNLELSNVAMLGNTAQTAYALSLYDSYLVLYQVAMRKQHNNSGSTYGGVNCRDHCDIQVTDCRFANKHNHAQMLSLRINTSRFMANPADKFGGAIFVNDAANMQAVELSDLHFTDNEATEGGALLVCEESAQWAPNRLLLCLADDLRLAISAHFATLARAIGRNLSFIHVSCRDMGYEPTDSDYFEDIVAFDIQHPSDFEEKILRVLDITNQWLIQLMRVRFKVMEQAKAMPKYLLMAQGDFIQQFLYETCEEMGKTVHIKMHDMQSKQESAVMQSNALYGDKDIRQRLCVKRLGSCDATTSSEGQFTLPKIVPVLLEAMKRQFGDAQNKDDCTYKEGMALGLVEALHIEGLKQLLFSPPKTVEQLIRP